MAKQKGRTVSSKQALRKLEHQKLKEEAVDRVGALFGDWLPGTGDADTGTSTLKALAMIRDIAAKTIKEIKKAQKGNRAPTRRKKR